MLRVWRSPQFRATMDIDMLGREGPEKVNIAAQIREIILLEVEPDGISFDPDSIQAESIIENAGYEGTRIRFSGILDSARVSMQIDIGFGDVVYPGPEVVDFPTLLDSPVPNLVCYSRESAIAEKFEAIVKLGFLNSRIKDFFDIWLLSRQFSFERATLAEAVRLTFEQRGTEMISDIDAFSEAFIDQKQSQWTAFYKRLKQEHIPEPFREIVKDVEYFLAPISSSILQGNPSFKTWKPTGPWL
jgi:hypothetical protein